MKKLYTHLGDNLSTSIVVLLVALPLCVGIALASGTPIFSGIIAGIIGYLALLKLKSMEKRILLNQHSGHVYEHPKFAFFFLLAALGVTGFPITTTFISEDLIFSHIESHQVMLAFFIASSFIVSGIAGIRIYTRLFLGPHIKTYHEIPYRSS